MTFNIGHIAGGSHAGWKRQKPAPREWICRCYINTGDRADVGREFHNAAYLARCPGCGTQRPCT